jgi:hypothetical protein
MVVDVKETRHESGLDENALVRLLNPPCLGVKCSRKDREKLTLRHQHKQLGAHSLIAFTVRDRWD